MQIIIIQINKKNYLSFCVYFYWNKMSSQFSSNNSSAEEGEDEFTPTKAIFPKTKDDGCSTNLDGGGQQHSLKAILERMNVLETQQRQNEAVTKEMVNQQVEQLQNDQKAFLDRIGELEKKQQKQEEKWTNALADQMESFLDKIGKMEKKQQQKSDNEQKALLGKINELEKQHQMLAQQMKTDSETTVNSNANMAKDTEEQQKKIWDKLSTMDNFIGILKDRFGKFDPANEKVFSEFRGKSNFWDVDACHEDLEISGPNCAMVQHKENVSAKGCWPNVFAKYSILHSAVDLFDMFYFELNVKFMKGWGCFGFAFKNQTPLNDAIIHFVGTYAITCNGTIYTNESKNSGKEKFGTGDTVGCGVNLANKQLFFTKNGHRIDVTNDFCISSSHSADSLFPFVSLSYSNEKIEANFGPEFMFDISTLC